jgi:Kef-type K+ transport system membrane component KefB
MSAVQAILVQIAVILLLARVMGLLMRLVHQPQVVGEMIAGIMLGPSLLGLIHHGAWMNFLFPPALFGNLQVLSQLGVMLFMFLVGLELDPKQLRGQGKAALVTGSVGIAVPFASGAILALLLIRYASSVTGSVPNRLVLGLFMGAAMSITAFPVLARILTERNLHKTTTGTLALTCAAMDDVLGWCILAAVLAIAQVNGFGPEAMHKAAGESAHHAAVKSAIRTVVFAAGYILLMVFVVRKILGRFQAHFETRGYLSQNVLAIIFLLLIASSVATEAIGIHQIFGAFLLGAVMPKEGRFIKHLAGKLEDFTVLFLLPLFFAYTGLRTELGLLGSPQLWLICGLIIAVAVAGKFGGVSIAAKWYGMNWRQSSLLGVLMNTRGLMELIILNIGLTFGVLSRPLFAMMVVMALATTFMTTPLMRLLYSPTRQKQELDAAARRDAEKVVGIHVVVPVSLQATAASLVRVGAMLMAGDPGRLYALHLDRPDELSRGAGNTYSESDRVVEVAQEAARVGGVSINAVTFVSRNIAADIADAARRYRASWVVMGWHKPLFFKNVMGGLVGQVLRDAPANVAIFVDKGLSDVKRIVVPYLGKPQDRGALMAAERMGRLPGVTVTILRVVKPGRGSSDSRLDLKTIMDREIPGSGENSVRMRIVETDSPIDAAVEESRENDLLVLGMSEDWQLAPGSMFANSESLAQRSACSVLIAHANPHAPVLRSTPAPPQEEELVTAD